MNVSVNGHQIDVGDALRGHIEESLSSIVDKYFGDAIDATVTLSRNGSQFRSVISLHIGRGVDAQASAEAHDVYPSFDSAAERLAKQLRRHKRKLRDHSGRGADDEVMLARQVILSGEDEEEDAGQEDLPVVVAEMETEIPSLTVSQAVMRLDLADLQTLMFHNRAHGGLNVVYRRQDGHVGWIDPQGSGK